MKEISMERFEVGLRMPENTLVVVRNETCACCSTEKIAGHIYVELGETMSCKTVVQCLRTLADAVEKKWGKTP